MIKKLHLKTLLLIAALLVGSSSAWADNITYTFSSKDWEASDGTNSANWTDYTSGDSFESADPARGIAKSKATINGTSPEVLSNVSSITVTASANQAGPTLTIYKVVNNVETSIYSASMTKDNNKSYTINLEGTNIFTGKIKVVLASSSSYKSVWIKSVAVTYSAQQKTAHGLSWSATSKDVTYSETPYNLPTLTNPHSLDVTYDSSDKSVATVASDGTVTIKNVNGSTNISAHTDGDETYAAGTVSYTLNVTRKAIIADGFFDFSLGLNYGSDMTTGSVAVHTATWTAVNITMDVAGRNCWYNDGTFRLYKESGGDAAGSVTLNCLSDKVITQIEFTGPLGSATGTLANITANTGTYNVTSTSAIWTGAAQSVTFTTGSASTYINTITVTYTTASQTATVQSYGWATYIPQFNVQFAANTAYVVTAASVANGLTLAAVTTVPAGTPLLLKGAGEKTATVVATATAPTTNLLSVCNGTIASGRYPYVLAKDGTGACFKKWTGETSALNGRVVLLLDEDLPAESSAFSLDDEMTGITGVNLNENQNENRYYDLQGRRVAQPTKGLYIINGKKVLVK